MIRAARDARVHRPATAERIAHVEGRYPGAVWNPHRWTATADGYMPFRVFAAYEAEIGRSRAAYRIDTAIGIGHAFGQKKDQPMSEAFARDVALARIPNA